MSALLQQANIYTAARRLSEAAASLEIARLAAEGIDADSTLARIAETALSIRGVRRVRIEPCPELSAHVGAMLVWGRDTGESVPACAVGEVKAGRWSWGQYRVYFDMRECRIDSPLAFSRFVAQQIASLLNRLALAGERDALLKNKARIADRLATRKAVERAKGILAERHALSQREALRLLISITRRSRRPLNHVAQSIIYAGA